MAHGHADRREPEASSPSSISRCRWRAAISSRRGSISRIAACSGCAIRIASPSIACARCEGGLDVGRELANWGEIRLGLRRGTGPLAVLIGDPTLPTRRVRARRFLRALLLRQARQHLLPASRPAVRVRMAWRAGEHRRRPGLRQVRPSWLDRAIVRSAHVDFLDRRWARRSTQCRRRRIFSRSAASSICRDCRRDFCPGRTMASVGCMYYRKIGRGGAGVLDLPAYAGVSLEAGNTWLDAR